MTADRSETRAYTPAELRYMGAIDGVLAVVGRTLRIGGLPLKRALIAGLGTLGHLAMKRQRDIAHLNLDLVYGDELSAAEKTRIVRGMFRHFARLGLDFIFDTAYWPPEELPRRVRAVGLEKLEAAFAMNRGVLCVSGHLGNWEMMCASAAAHGYDFFGIFKRPRSAWADRFIGRKRLRYGMSLLETRAKRSSTVDGVTETRAGLGVREDVEAIWSSGRAVAFLCDQYPGERGVPLDFLGVPDTPTAAGLMRYAVANRVPITYHSCVYQPDGNLLWTVEGPTEIEDQPGGEEATVLHHLGRVNDWLSERIRRYPEQWTWGHRRFARSLYPPRRRRFRR